MAQAERRLAAIMFTDIVGYTALMAESEEKGLRARERHRALVRPLVERYHGEWIEARGDESLSLFPSALDAVNCALAVQEKLERDLEKLRLHIGIHQSDIVLRQGEVMGDGVNIAARICALSDGSGPYISDEVQHAVQNQAHLSFDSLGDHEFKNVPRPVPVYRVTGAAQSPGRIALLHRLGIREPRRWLAAAVVLLALIGFGTWSWYWYWAAELAPIRSIAVLPLENLSGDPEQEYFADGLTEALIGDLAKIGSLRVISRTSVMRYRRSDKSLPEIGRELGVEAIVEGTVLRDGDRVRITAQLIDARNDHHIWNDRYDRDLAGMLAMQSEVASAVAAQIRARLTADERVSLRAPQVDPGAYDEYVRGLKLFDVEGATFEAVASFERAVQLDPGFTQAYAWLATSRMKVASQFLGPAEKRVGVMTAAIDAANRALALDERQGLAHSTIGLVRVFQWDFAEAGRSLERAIQLTPSDPRVLFAYSWYLLMVGRIDEARQVTERLRLVAPLDPVVLSQVAMNFFYTRDYERALDAHQRAFELEPVTEFHLSFIYAQLGRMEEAHAAGVEVSRRWASVGVPGREELAEAQERGWTEGGIEGYLREPLELMIELESRGLYSPTGIALTYARLGEVDEAFVWLERAYDAREAVLYSLKIHPYADALRSDPRFQDLLRRIGFPES